MAEEAVFGVVVIGRLGGELVGAAKGYFADEGFDGPVIFDEIEGEVIEEFWVAGELAGFAEVVGGADDSLPEEVFPNAVGHDAGGEGVVGIGDPVGEFEAAGVIRGNVGAGAGLHGDGDETTRDFGPFVADLSADVDVAVGDGIGFRDGHGDGVEFFEICGDGSLFFFEGFEISFDFRAINEGCF